MNEFETIKVFEEIVKNPDHKDFSFYKLYKAFYQALLDKFEFGVMGEGPFSKKGEAFFYDGIEFTTLKKVESIKDESTKNFLHSSLVPGYGDRFLKIPHEDPQKNYFEKAYSEYPLNYQERIENVEYLLDANSDDLENLTSESFEYKDMVFGESVIPVTDKRIREIVSHDYMEEEMARLKAEQEAELSQITISDDMSLSEQHEVYQKQNQLEMELESSLSKLMNFEDQFKKFKVDFADMDNQLKQKRISESEYEQKRKTMLNDFSNIIKTGRLADDIPPEKLKELSNSLTSHPNTISQNQVVIKETPVKEPSSNSVQRNLAIALLVMAIAFLLLAIRNARNGQNKY